MHGKGAESLDMASGRRSRSTSISSDTGLPRINLLSPPSVNPKPAFIASPAASQIITTDQEFNTADFVAEDEGPGATACALVTPAALGALNGFLDHLLFNILAAAKSTRLSCIRPAVADVLKPRLAREVVSAADDELSEYIGGTEDEQFEFPGGQESIAEFDLVRSWKLTRLRCMVYTRLGDMEEDDEDEYIAQESLGEPEGSSQRFTSNVGNITPAAAIFLSSIVEYIGEQALVIAGETARSRLATQVADRDEVTESGTERSSMNRLVVEELDMEKLALNSTLGRLWRTWRKCIRSQTLGRAVSRESFRRPASIQPLPRSRKSSIVTAEDAQSRSMPVTAEEPVDPVAIPLPMSQHDVREIEIPGFSADLDGEIQTLEAVVAHKVRPRSLMVFSPPSNSPRSPSSTASSPILSSSSPCAKASHGRSRSLPNASYFPDGPWTNEQTVTPTADEVTPDASEDSKRLETMYEYDEQSEPVNAQTGIAISTEQVNDAERELRKEASADSLPGEKKDAPGVDDDASMEVVASQASSVSSSAETAVEQQQLEGETIEGQGMVEKPKPAVQRPKRKSSKEPNLAMRPVTEDQPSRQGEASTELMANHGGSRQSDTSAAGATFFVTEGQTSNDEPVANKTVQEPTDSSGEARTPSESASGDSGRSEPSRTRPKPSQLILPSGSSHASGKSVPSPGTERAAVQRVSIRPSPSITSSTHSNPRRSDSFTSAREKRPVTSGSTTSQVSTKLKGLIGRQPGEATSPRFRSSSETSRASGGSGDSDNLEKLIKSDETLHFTLTPKSMREMEKPDSPRWRTVPRSDNAAQTEPAQSTGAAANESQEPGGSNPSRKTVDLASMSKSKSAELPKARPAERMSVQSKPKATQARDARPTGESTRDFADFIKSSGPPIPPSPGPSGARAPNPADATPVRSVNAVPKSPSRGNGPKLQARSAVPAKGDQTSDLIDFIREGPPAPGVHRIPRVVAPFRDTTDSEDPETSEPERLEKNPLTGSSLASTQGSSVANKSFTSVGSRTGLLESTQRTTTQTGPNSKVPSPSTNVSDDPFPARKQRRVKDPYAIDSDDEDDLDELLEPQKPKREEESLMDFLRNVPPPEAQPPPQPFNISSNKTGLLGKQSASPAKSTVQQQPGASPAGQSNYAVKVGMERNGGSVRGPGIGGRQTETSALADFLKNTGPPEPPAPRAPEKKESGANSLSRLFTRRKKVEV